MMDKRARKRRTQYAKVLRQQMHLISIYGHTYAANGTLEQVTLTDLKRSIRQSVLRRTCANKNVCMRHKDNADHAIDICRHGRESSWYFARRSNNGACGDKRGIKHYLHRFARRGSTAARRALKDNYGESARGVYLPKNKRNWSG